MQAARRAGFNTSRLQALAHSVSAQCALENALGLLVQFRNIEWTSRNAVAAANALILLKIHDTVGVLDDRAVCGARSQAAWICAVHALVFPHQPHQRAVISFVLVEKDQVPVIP